MAESSLTVHLRPVASEQEQAAMDAALDTLIEMALRKIVEEREYKSAIRRGNESILLELSNAVRE